MSSLRNRAMSGGRWMMLNQVVGQAFRLTVSILLTKLISPSDFGLVAKVFAITGIIELVFSHGVFGSIIQSKKVQNIHSVYSSLGLVLNGYSSGPQG